MSPHTKAKLVQHLDTAGHELGEAFALYEDPLHPIAKRLLTVVINIAAIVTILEQKPQKED